MIAGPGVAHGTTFAPASTIDLPSTILEIAGAPPRGGTDGVSLLPELGDPNRGWVRPIVIEGRMYGMPASPEVPDGLSSSGIRTGRFKYIRYSTGEEEFYDLLNDPNELESLHNDPAYADIKAQLITVWQNRRACAGDPCRAPLPPELQLDTNDLRALDANARAQYALYYQN